MSSTTRTRLSELVASNTDLAAVAGYVAVITVVLAVPGDLPTVVTLPLVLPVLLFAPGYAVVTAIVPASRDASRPDPIGGHLGDRHSPDGLSTLERLTLSVVTSIALVPLVAFALTSVVGVALVPTLAGVTLVTVVAAFGGAVRRQRTGLRSRTGTTDRTTTSALLDGVPTDAITLGCATIAVLMLVSSAAIAVTGTPAANTEFYLVEETATGQYAADGYAQTLTQGTTATYSLGIEQHGATSRQYTVVALLEKRTRQGVNATLIGRHELDRYETTVPPNEATVQSHDVTPTTAGDNLTLTFLLYRGDAPDDPSRETASRTVSLPVDVIEG